MCPIYNMDGCFSAFRLVHGLPPCRRGSELHLGGTGIGETGIEPGVDKRFQKMLVHYSQTCLPFSCSVLTWSSTREGSGFRSLLPTAMELLENTHKRHPADRDTLLALVSIARETSDFATAVTHARELVALYPTDMQLRMLVLDLEKRQAH